MFWTGRIFYGSEKYFLNYDFREKSESFFSRHFDENQGPLGPPPKPIKWGGSFTSIAGDSFGSVSNGEETAQMLPKVFWNSFTVHSPKSPI